ncbi:MAG TPA: hypothetical protein DCW29_02575 [Janthinobacterium sp.]|nr:hypothetical protein [Janthinobacterium sp.]
MNTLPPFRLICLAGALSLAANASADSFTSSASSAGSASSGSVSGSLHGSSDSSSGGNKVADGAYRIIDVAAAPGPAGMARITIVADAARPPLVLDLPQATFDKQGLGKGDLVYAKNRVYGIEFARNDTRLAFYLVLADEYYDELAPRPVSL